MQNNEQKIQIRSTDAQLAGSYANAMSVAHTKEEFILDFASIVGAQGVLVSRVIVNPAHLKRIAKALADNLAAYERSFGPVEDTSQGIKEMGFHV